MEVEIYLDEETYWKIHEELSKAFKPHFPNLNQLSRGIFIYNTVNHIFGKHGIVIGRNEDEKR